MRNHATPVTRALSALLAAAIAGGTLSPTFALAQPKKKVSIEAAPDDVRARARQHYGEAEKRFAAGDFAGAYTEYKGANDLLPAPQTLWKMATCMDKLGNPVESFAAYQAFLGASPPESMADRVQIANERIAELKKSLPGRVDVATDPAGASVLVDGAPQIGKTPVSLQLPPGSHELKFTLPGYEDAARHVDAVGGSSQWLKVPLAPAKAPVVAAVPPPAAKAEKPAEPAKAPAPEKKAEKSPPPELPSSNATSWVLFGFGGAAAAVGTVFGIKALGDKHDFDGGEKTSAKADATARDALIADISFAAAVTLGFTGVMLWNGSGSKEKEHVVLTPIVSPHVAGAGASLTF